MDEKNLVSSSVNLQPSNTNAQQTITQAKKDPLTGNPKQTGFTALGFAIASYLVFGFGLSIAAVVLGVFGIYGAIKSKSGIVIILLNFLAIILGFIANVLSYR